jgi:ubiquinone/menaquinone biosynthesis C-methylase UbiE
MQWRSRTLFEAKPTWGTQMRSNIERQLWGEKDPLYAVATWPGKDVGSTSAWKDTEFYELGRSDWADFSAQWQQYGLKPGHCVEIGCGAGRITKQLAGTFDRVTGLDVSKHQLDYAKEHVPASVSLIETTGSQIPLGDSSCNAVFSVHVFQHFNSLDDAEAVFREIGRVLEPGGTLMIHLPLYHLPTTPVTPAIRFALALLWRLSDIKAELVRWLIQRGVWRPLMRSLRFEREWLLQTLTHSGLKDIQFRTFTVNSNGGWHDFVIARSAK